MVEVLVVGSLNQDVTVVVRRFPAPGETLLGESVAYGLGGKGANQAVAVARAGVGAALLASVGDDAAGTQLSATLAGYGVDTSLLTVVTGTPTGSAHITVDASGRNQIVVVPGANGHTTPQRVTAAADAVRSAKVVVTQGEIPADTVATLVALAHESATIAVLNLAPVIALPAQLLERVGVLVVNETEAAELAGGEPPADPDAAAVLAGRLTERVPAVVITLGAQGAVVAERGGEPRRIPAPAPERVVDTTGAGDALVGVLAAALARGSSLAVATQDAVRAASRTVEAPGAAPSYPRFALSNAR
jgi:ribokinase